jgi:hypothetical protein
MHRSRLTASERSQLKRERERLLASNAYLKAIESRSLDITRREVESFFRVDDYVVGLARERKVTRLKAMFDRDPQLGAIVKDLAELLRRLEGRDG